MARGRESIEHRDTEQSIVSSRVEKRYEHRNRVRKTFGLSVEKKSDLLYIVGNQTRPQDQASLNRALEDDGYDALLIEMRCAAQGRHPDSRLVQPK